MVLMEFTFHSVNLNVLMNGVFKVQDIGGVYCDHMFGCYFGLAISWVLGKPIKTEPDGGHVADVFSLIGTTFLWVYWPSFVAGWAPVDSEGQQNALVNTILSLCASTVAAYFCSNLFTAGKGKARFRTVDIQNATLAGGVAIGCLANYRLNAGICLLIGSSAGALSTFGYCVIQPWILEKYQIHDTCGINNLHGINFILDAY